MLLGTAQNGFILLGAHAQVEGTCSAKYGYIIAVLTVDNIDQVCTRATCPTVQQQQLHYMQGTTTLNF